MQKASKHNAHTTHIINNITEPQYNKQAQTMRTHRTKITENQGKERKGQERKGKEHTTT